MVLAEIVFEDIEVVEMVDVVALDASAPLVVHSSHCTSALACDDAVDVAKGSVDKNHSADGVSIAYHAWGACHSPCVDKPFAEPKSIECMR